MTRLLSSIALVIAVTTSQVDAVPTTSTVDSSCKGAISTIEYPLERISNGTLVLRVKEVIPISTSVYVRACLSDKEPVIVNGSDPSTWLVTLPGQCAQFWVNETSTPEGCMQNKVTVESSQLSGHCAQEASADTCFPIPPSSAMRHTLTTTTAVAVSALVASLTDW